MTKVRLILDSGAFTSWSKGESIDLQEYIDFCLAHRRHLHAIVALDEIPRGQGKARTPAQTEAAAKTSHANLRRMRDAGLAPIAVFHQGERFYWLDKMLDEGSGYIGLGGISRAGRDIKERWLDSCFNRLSGQPSKIHGFGLTDIKTIYSYPWTSVDSVSWKLISGFGSIMLPSHPAGGHYDFQTARDVVVSDRSEGGHLPAGMGQLARAIEAYAVWAGASLKEVVESCSARERVNIQYFRGLASQSVGKSITCSPSFFAPMVPHTLQPRSIPVMIALGTSYAVERDLGVLVGQHYYDQLVSYYSLMNHAPTFDLGGYVQGRGELWNAK